MLANPQINVISSNKSSNDAFADQKYPQKILADQKYHKMFADQKSERESGTWSQR